MRLSARKSYLSELSETARDFAGATFKFSLARNLAVQDIRTRYRGSVLGPWWITLTMGALVLGIGVNYAALFHMEVKDLLPYVALGLVAWAYVNGTISEGGEAFFAGGAIIRQSSLPVPLFIVRCVIRNVINLAHHVVIVVAVMIWFRIAPTLGILLLIPGFIIVTINLAWMSLILATISARFRDVPQIVAAVLQFVFFLTPIFWKPTPQMSGRVFLNRNPFYSMVEVIRSPVLTGTVPIKALIYLVLLALVGWFIALMTYNLTRRRVVHYL